MKKLLSLMVCCVLLIGLLAACGAKDASAPPFDASAGTEEAAEKQQTDAPEDTQAASVVEGINYKGICSRTATLEDFTAAEGREPDLEYAVDESTTLYIYNDVTLDALSFSQVQISFSEANVRISCTCQGDPTGTVTGWKDAMTSLYGEPSDSNGTYMWHDETGNYITLCALNEDTAQLAFYLCRE